MAKSFNKEHLVLIKKRKPIPCDLAEEIVYQIVLLATALFRHNPDALKTPSVEELTNSFAFRYSLSIYLLMVRWLSDGGARGVNPEKLTNDVIDMGYVAYATFFNGLLSKDKKMNEIYEEVSFLLTRGFSYQTLRNIGVLQSCKPTILTDPTIDIGQ